MTEQARLIEIRMAQLEKQKQALAHPPRPQAEIDWTALIATTERFLNDAIKYGAMDEDARYYIYEEVMRAIYGPQIFDWLRVALD